MNTEADLTSAFAAITAPLSHVTTADAVRLGRRSQRLRRRGRTGAAVAGVVVAVLGGVALAGPDGSTRTTTVSATPPSVAATDLGSGSTCPVTRLTSEPGISAYDSDIVGIDPTGHYVIANGDSAVRFRDTRPTVIPLPAGIHAGNMLATAVNANGIVVGVAETGTNDNRHGWAWKWQDGTLTRLPMPYVAGAVKATPTGINSRGDIVGTADTQAGGPGAKSDQYAVEWPADSDAVRILAVPAADDGSDAYAISDTGYIVGDVGFAAGLPYYWDPAGLGHRLAVVPGAPQGRAFDIVGQTIYGESGNTAAQWNLGTGKVSVNTGFTQTLTGNVRGDVVIRVHGTGDTVVLIGDRQARLSLPAGITGTAEPAAIADDGTVAGWIQTTHSLYVAIWHC
jgi:probable HAF family extracellular repeat protein